MCVCLCIHMRTAHVWNQDLDHAKNNRSHCECSQGVYSEWSTEPKHIIPTCGKPSWASKVTIIPTLEIRKNETQNSSQTTQADLMCLAPHPTAGCLVLGDYSGGVVYIQRWGNGNSRGSNAHLYLRGTGQARTAHHWLGQSPLVGVTDRPGKSVKSSVHSDCRATLLFQ